MDLLNMTNRAKNFILQARVSTIDDLLGEWMLAINAKFQLNISNMLRQPG